MCFPLNLSSLQIENSLYLANFLSELHKSLHVKAPAAEFIQSGKVFLPIHFCRACCEGKWVLNRQAVLHGKKIKFLRSPCILHAWCLPCDFYLHDHHSARGRLRGKARSERYEEGNKNGDELKMTSFPYIFNPKRKGLTHLLFTKAFPAATLQVQWETNRLLH